MSVPDQLAELRQRRENAAAERARAEATRDSAKRQLEAARKELADEFGISTPEEAAAMVQTLESELAAEMQRVQDALAASGS